MAGPSLEEKLALIDRVVGNSLKPPPAITDFTTAKNPGFYNDEPIVNRLNPLITDELRTNAVRLAGSPDELARIIKKMSGLETGYSDRYGVIVKHPKKKEWSPIDPEYLSGSSDLPSTDEDKEAGFADKAYSFLNELKNELGENAQDLAAGALIDNPLVGLVAGTANAGLKQAEKYARFGEVPNIDDAATQVLGDIAGGTLNKVGPLGSKLGASLIGKGIRKVTGQVKVGAEYVAEKSFTNFLTEQELASFAKGELPKAEAIALAKTRVKTSAKGIGERILNDPTRLAKEFGAGPEDFKGKEDIVESISWLQENAPDELGKILKVYKPRERFLVAKEEVDRVGSEIGAFYEKNPIEIPVSKLLATVNDKGEATAYGELSQLSTDIASPQLTAGVARVHRDFKQSIAKKVLPTDQFSAYKAGKLHEIPLLQGIGVKNNEEAFKLLTQNKDITLGDLWQIRRERDSFSRWGTGQKLISEALYAHRLAANAARETMDNAIKEAYAGLPLGEEILKRNQTFHKLAPLVEVLDSTQAHSRAEGFRLSRWVPGVINSPMRRAILQANLISTNPTMQGALRAGIGKMQSAGITTEGIPSLDTSTLGRIKQGAQSLMTNAGPLQNISYNQVGRQVGYNMTEPPKIPRDPDLIANDPALQSYILSKVPPDIGVILKQAWGSKNPAILTATTAQLISSMPQDFEPSTSGVMSEVKSGDHFVIGNPAEAEIYKRTISGLRQQGKVDANFWSEQLSALNDKNDLRILPRPDLVQKEE